MNIQNTILNRGLFRLNTQDKTKWKLSFSYSVPFSRKKKYESYIFLRWKQT